MSAAQNTHWVTIEEFDRIAAGDDERELELFEGEVLEVTFPIWKHAAIQERLVDLLRPLAANKGIVRSEVAYQIARVLRPVKRRADVAYVSADRSRAAHESGILDGAPDLVIEVLSPSNSAGRMYRLEWLCMNNGCEEFWTVDLETQSIRVVGRSATNVYQCGDSIPLTIFEADSLPVGRVFEGIL